MLGQAAFYHLELTGHVATLLVMLPMPFINIKRTLLERREVFHNMRTKDMVIEDLVDYAKISSHIRGIETSAMRIESFP